MSRFKQRNAFVGTENINIIRLYNPCLHFFFFSYVVKHLSNKNVFFFICLFVTADRNRFKH